MWTIFDAGGRAVANCDFEPDSDDLAARTERAVYHQEAIALDEIMLEGGSVRRKPFIGLSALVNGLTAIVSVTCDAAGVSEIPLLIGGIRVAKPPGDFIITGEAGVSLLIDFEREYLRGNSLEVLFNA